ncbi:protein-L-isoaspartate(D-aspartate) O-methyltransferase [Muricoccus radiodurans]|uniref:protein-L-isoaspartate(D-aspartate) O-methyltransferase n=1 Tax=Muricoccus radiodurans TaxID=2231721 RepID=UPI003CF8E041
MDETSLARDRMVEEQIARRGVQAPAVLAAMRTVPRESFVPEELRRHAHEDRPLPIAAGQTISQPFVVALMAEALALRPTDRVLEVGAGSGYAAAVLSRLAAQVHAVERYAELAASAAGRLRELGYDNVELHIGDGTTGWPAAAPFDAILVSAGGPAVPPALTDQLAPDGRLVIPVGETPGDQRLLRVTRNGPATLSQEDLGAVRFVPLIGAQGWTEDGRRAAEWLRP